MEDDWSDDAPWTERQGGLSSQDLSFVLDPSTLFGLQHFHMLC